LALAVLLASVCSAGLVAATSSDLAPFAPVRLSGALLIPGLMLVGALLAVAINDAVRAAAGLALAALLGASLYGFALSAPGFKVHAVQVQLINRGTTQGLVVFMLTLLFGLAGMMAAFLAAMLLGKADM
jgi:hypothetical protein